MFWKRQLLNLYNFFCLKMPNYGSKPSMCIPPPEPCICPEGGQGNSAALQQAFLVPLLPSVCKQAITTRDQDISCQQILLSLIAANTRCHVN